MYKYVNFISIGFLVVELVMINDENRFRVFEDQYMQIQIILNILCQFFAYTSTTVIINKHVNYMSVGFLIVELLAMIDDKD